VRDRHSAAADRHAGRFEALVSEIEGGSGKDAQVAELAPDEVARLPALNRPKISAELRHSSGRRHR
jgi:hypothetical protein